MSTCNQYESQSKTTNDIGAFRPTTKTAAKKMDRSGTTRTRIFTKRKTTEGLPEATNSIGVTKKIICSKGERPIGDRKHNGDQGAKTSEKRASMHKLGKTNC